MRLNKGFGLFNFSGDCLLDLNNFKRFSFSPWMWRFPAMFCHAGPSSLAFLARQIAISKSRRMDCSLNENYIIYGELRCDSVCSWILTTACFSGENVSLWAGVRSSSLGDNFWKSLHLLQPCYCSVIPTLWSGKTMVSVLHANLISCRVG